MDQQTVSKFEKWSEPKNILLGLGILVFGAIVIVSILRERIVTPVQNQVTITGQGKLAYKADLAKITLGVQIDRAPTGQDALGQLNSKVKDILAAVEAVGIPEQDIQNEAYALSSQYDYRNNVQTLAGYSANQKIVISAFNLQNDPELLNKIIAAASAAGSNQLEGIVFSVSNVNELKQQARVLAMQDAKAKTPELAKASGVKLGKVTSWVENIIQAPDQPQGNPVFAGADTVSAMKAAPQIPNGTQEIIVEVGLVYEVK